MYIQILNIYYALGNITHLLAVLSLVPAVLVTILANRLLILQYTVYNILYHTTYIRVRRP